MKMQAFSSKKCETRLRPLLQVWGVLTAKTMTTEPQGIVPVQWVGVRHVVRQTSTIYVPEVNAIVQQIGSFISLVLLASWLATKLFDQLNDGQRHVTAIVDNRIAEIQQPQDEGQRKPLQAFQEKQHLEVHPPPDDRDHSQTSGDGNGMLQDDGQE